MIVHETATQQMTKEFKLLQVPFWFAHHGTTGTNPANLGDYLSNTVQVDVVFTIKEFNKHDKSIILPCVYSRIMQVLLSMFKQIKKKGNSCLVRLIQV